MNQHKIIYCGMDAPTFHTLVSANDFHLVAVNRLAAFENFNAKTPADFLFKSLYRSLIKNKKCKSIWFVLLKILCFFPSQVAKKYGRYLKELNNHPIHIQNFDNVELTIAYIKKNNIDLIVVNNWWILPVELLNAPKRGVLNIHPSLLPAYRGSIPILCSLKNKDKETAVTFMLLSAGMDDGDILRQYPIAITANDDAIKLEDKCNAIIDRYLINDIVRYLQGGIQPFKQNHQHASKTAKYYEYQKIDWASEVCEDMVNKINYYPYAWPLDCCYSYLDNQKVDFYHAQLIGELPKKINYLLNEKSGVAIVYRNNLYIRAIDGVVRMKLFFDLSIKDSIKIIKDKKNLIFT